MIFDIYSGMCYIHLNNGSILQCDCNTNPAIPFQRLVPAMAFDEEVCSIASVKVVHTDRKNSVTAVIAGLRNGQIVLVRPNDYWMTNVQAHENAVRFMKTVSSALPSEGTRGMRNIPDFGFIPNLCMQSGDRPEMSSQRNLSTSLLLHSLTSYIYITGKTDYCRDMLFSVSAYCVRVWEIIVGEFSILPKHDKQITYHGKVATKVFQLRPLKKFDLPAEASRPKLVAVLEDRICAVSSDGAKTVVVTDGRAHSTLAKHSSKAPQYLQNSEFGDVKVKNTTLPHINDPWHTPRVD